MYRLVFQNHEVGRAPFVGRASTTTIGRAADCTLQLAAAGISDQHAAIERRPDGLYIRDLGSATGVRVNGERVREHRLTSGDEIELGAVRAGFEIVHEPPADQRVFDPWQIIAVVVVALLVAGQVGVFAWIFSQDHPRNAKTDIVKRQQSQPKPASNDASRVIAPLPATETSEAPVSAVLNRMIRITRVDRQDGALRIQVKAQVGERMLDPEQVGISVQCGEKLIWVKAPKDWENFATRTLSAPCVGSAVRSYYRNKLQDEWINH